MDNEKFQEFMANQFAKMFKELQDFKKDVTTEFTDIKSEIKAIKTELSEVKQSQVRMETEFGKKLDVLYSDWRETQKKFNEEEKLSFRFLALRWRLYKWNQLNTIKR